MAESEKSFRPWVAWSICGVWAGMGLLVWIALKVHPAATANLVIHTRKISFHTDAVHILGSSNEEQLLISGLASLRIGFSKQQTVQLDGVPTVLTSLDATGGPRASCSFYRVRTGGFDMRSPSVITLGVMGQPQGNSFSLTSHGDLNGNLSSLGGEHDLPTGFECRGLSVAGRAITELEGRFSSEGGDAIFAATAPDSRLDFSLSGQSEAADTQIPITSELRFSEIDPLTADEKSVLLAPGAEITFEKVNKKMTVDPADLLIVVPEKDFYLREFTVKDAIRLSLHGGVRDIRSGAGPRDLETRMPSLFEGADNATRIFGAIAALAGVLIGILEKAGWLGKK